jgi:hypothetical protein
MKITADEAPYYIEFEDDSIQQVKSLLNEQLVGKFFVPYNRAGSTVLPIRRIADIHLDRPETFHVLSYEVPIAKKILALIPVARILTLNPFRVSVFVAPPGFHYRPHKDGLDLQFGVNYPLVIEDERCITSWFAEKTFAGQRLDFMNNSSREVTTYDSKLHHPVKSFTMNPDRAVLFNVGEFHEFVNDSPNHRIILTLRPMIQVPFDVAAARLRRVCS